MTFAEIKKTLKNKGDEIVAVKAALSGAKAYKVIGSKDHNEYALWTAAQIREAFKHGDL